MIMYEEQQAERAEANDWLWSIAQSGTQTIHQLTGCRGSPNLHVGHAAEDCEGDHLRSEISSELTVWLNGGPEPWWLDMLHRKTPDTVVTPHGCEIRAMGPMVDTAEPPQWGLWKEDDSEDAQIARGLLADALMKRERPDFRQQQQDHGTDT